MVCFYTRMIRNFLFVRRSLYTQVLRCASSPLAALRKKTGYSVKKCKEALLMHQNDLEKAEAWLFEIGQKEGWAKAAQVKDRTALQGLVGVGLGRNAAAMVEINCETDFVARNENFRDLASRITQRCVSLAEQQISQHDNVVKSELSGEKIASVTGEDKTLGDEVALAINQLKENLVIRRGILFKGGDGVFLQCNTHPVTQHHDVLLGKYGSVVVVKSQSQPEKQTLVQLCSHIIGMNPSSLGSIDDIDEIDSNLETEDAAHDATSQSIDVSHTSQHTKVSDTSATSEDGSESEEETGTNRDSSKDNETRLLQQTFLLDEDKTVGRFAKESDLEVLDFYRFQCGESIESLR